MSAAAFALSNKLKKIIGDVPTETPVETVTPTESIEPTETPTESIIPTETPIESTEPTETATPEPTMSIEERNLEQQYKESTWLFGIPWILKIKVNGVTKSIIVTPLLDQTNSVRFFVDRFSYMPVDYYYYKDINNPESDFIHYGAGPLKNAEIEYINLYIMDEDAMEKNFGIYGFDITKYPTLGDLRKFYDTKITESERIEQLPVLVDLTGIENIIKWNEDYDGYKISNSNNDYINNVTLSASSKESLNSKLIASGLLKHDNNINIVGYQKIIQKKA